MRGFSGWINICENSSIQEMINKIDDEATVSDYSRKSTITEKLEAHSLSICP